MKDLFFKRVIFFFALVMPLSTAYAEDISPDESTPLQVATYGCITGMEHPGRKQLSFEDQFSACNTFVDLMGHEDDIMGARRHRGTFLAVHATTAEHRNLAFEDLSFLIENGTRRASVFRMRAVLNFRDRRDPEAALSDINTAIERSQDRIDIRYFKIRASILIHLAQAQNDKTFAQRALEDVRAVLEREPDDGGAREAEEWLIDFLDD